MYQSNTLELIGTPIYNSESQSITSYVSSGLEADTTYYFTVRVYNRGGLYSDSNQVFAKTQSTMLTTNELLLSSAILLIAVVVVTLLWNYRKRKKGV